VVACIISSLSSVIGELRSLQIPRQACRLVLLVQPSLVAAKHVFLIITSSFSSQQELSL